MSFDPSTAAPEDGFDPTSAVPEDAPDTRTVLQTAVKANPEQAAKASKLAKKYDAPEDVLYRNLQNVELIDAVNRYDERLKTSPKLAAAMQRKPSLAQQAHDDIEPLAQIEQFLSDTGGSVKAGVYNANKGAAGVFRAGFEAIAPALDFLEPVAAVGGNPLRRLAEGFAMIGEQSGADAKAVTPKTEGNLSSGFQSGVQSLTQNLLTLPVAFLPGGQPAALGMMASTTGGMAYQDARDKGLPMERALPYAASQAAIEYATEKLPLGKLVGDLKEGTPFFKTLMHNIAGELPGEQVATLLQDLNDWAVLNPEKPFAGYLAERPDAAAQTLVATIVGSGGAVTLTKAAESVVGKFGKEAERAGQAQASAEQLQAQMQAAAQAKLRERNPDEFRELMSHMSDRSVYVDGDVLNQLAPEVRALLPQAVQEQIEIAAGTGDAVEIPVADVLTVAPGTPLEQMFVEHARTDPFAMSQAESKAAGEKVGEYLRTQSEEAITAAADQEAFRASSEAVRQNILSQLNEAARYRPAVNEGMAQWAGAFYTTMASRLGMTPEQMHQQFPLRILSEPRSTGQVMDQGGVTVTDQMDEVTGLPLNSDGTVTVYHHTSKANADAIAKSGKLKAAAEPDVYVTTRKETDTGYGDTAVAIRVKPEQLQIDDEFPDGRVDYRINVGKPGGAAKVQVGEPAQQSDNLNQTATSLPPTIEIDGKQRPTTNSNGQMIAATEEGVKNFWKWFGDSRVVDAEGRPLVVYHGTTASIDEFRSRALGVNTNAKSAFGGFFFTNSPRNADEYSMGSAVRRGEVSVKEIIASWSDEDRAEYKAAKEYRDSLKPKGARTDGWMMTDEWVRRNRAVSATFEYLLEKNDAGPNTIPVYLSIQKPLEHDMKGAEYRDISYADLIAESKKKRRDGTVIRNTYDPLFGDVFITKDPTQIKSAIGNSGEFDPTNPSILNQTATQGPRATFNPKTLELVLNPNADLSSFFHETGHFFLEVMSDIASQPDAPAQIVDDMNKLLSWFGVPDLQTWNSMTLDQQRPYHERFAESIEQYLMEGKAPSLELQPVMRRFRAWLLSVYKSIKAFLASRGVVAPTGGGALNQAPLAPAIEIDGKQRPTTNSNGQPIAATEEGVRNFWKWFGDSKVVDAEGKPLVVYHGTAADFDTFQENDRGVLFVSPSREWVSKFYTDETGATVSGANTMSVYVRADNPFDFENKKHVGALATSASLGKLAVDQIKSGSWSRLEDRTTLATIKKRFDGLYVSEDGNKNLAVFNPAQIKSAIGNSGEFDPTNPSILAQNGPIKPSDIQLNDDIRRVMDRMLATDEQIQQANEVAGLVPDETADGEAAERLQKRSIADLKWAVKARDKALKALRAQAKTIEKGIREQVSQEVDATPEMQAKVALDKLRKAKELNDATRATVADAFGYANTDEMRQAIDAYGKRSEVIDALTERRMLEEHGDLIDERAIQEAANEAVHNEARARSLATELRTQSEMLNPRQDTGRVNSKGSKITVNALVEAAKQYGQNVADRTVLKDLKNKAWQHTAAERRASTRWKEATAKGDTQAAVKAKQDQMLNNAAAKAVIDAKSEAAKIFEFFKRVTKGDNETVVEKGRDADIVNAARAVLAAYGVETATTKKADAYLELVKRNDPDTYGIIFPMVDGAMREAQPLESLTVEQLRALNEDIEAIWYKAKQSRQMEIDGDLMDRQDIEDELKAQIQEVGVPDHMPGDTSAITPAEQRALKLKHYLATARRVESWAQGLDGSKKLGPFRKFIWQPIKEAADALRVDKAKYLKRYRDLLKGVESTLVKETIAAPELGYTFGKDTDGVAMVEVLHAILHTGNESNKRKLLLGREDKVNGGFWAAENPDGTLDTRKWDAFVARMISEGKITKAHYDFAQGVWDLLEDTKPLAQKAHRYVFGRYFAEVTADVFDTPFGQYQGGYVPAQTDARTVTDAATRALAEAENDSLQFAFPTTNKGFTKSRVEYNRPLLLDLRALSQHIDKVLLFSHMEQPVRDVRKLLTAKGVAYGLNRVDPVAFDTILTPWLNRAAKQLVATPAPNNWQGWRFWSTLRNRAGMAAMFGNIANAVQQLAGFSMAAVKVKPKHLMGATAQFIANPKQVSEMVSSKSAYMDGRLANEVANMSDAINEILVNPNIYEKTKNFTAKHAYFVQSAVDSVMGPIIWSGAYNQALTEGFEDRDAVRLADSAVRETQGSTSPEDISAFEEGSPFTRLFTQFAGYFNMQANLLGTEFQVLAREMGLKKGAGRGLYVLTFGFLVNAWAAEAIMQLFKGGPDDEDKDGEYLDDWLKQVFGWSLLRNTTAMVPLFGQAANALVNASNSKPYDDRMATSPAISMLEATAKAPMSVYKAVAEDGKASRAVRDVGTLIAMTVGIPLAPITKPLGYAADVAQGNVKPTSPVDAARGVVTGTASPESKR